MYMTMYTYFFCKNNEYSMNTLEYQVGPPLGTHHLTRRVPIDPGDI